MARLVRSTLPDGFYHVTTRGVARCPIFLDDDDRIAFLELLAFVVRLYRWRCHAFCLMTNHYHLVLETTRARLSDGVHRLNGRYAQEFNARYDRSGHLFGARFASWLIEEEDHLNAACEYVLLNPVRAGLCEEPKDWRWSGAAALSSPGRTYVR
jgi:REP element-mobilizing transposase RayT